MKKAHRFDRILGLMIVAYAAASFLGLLGPFSRTAWLSGTLASTRSLGAASAAERERQTSLSIK